MQTPSLPVWAGFCAYSPLAAGPGVPDAAEEFRASPPWSGAAHPAQSRGESECPPCPPPTATAKLPAPDEHSCPDTSSSHCEVLD